MFKSSQCNIPTQEMSSQHGSWEPRLGTLDERHLALPVHALR